MCEEVVGCTCVRRGRMYMCEPVEGLSRGDEAGHRAPARGSYSAYGEGW